MCVGLAEHERLIRSAAAGPGQRASCCSAPRRAATGSAGRPCWPPPSWTRATSPSGPPCRSATRSRRTKLLECCLELLERELLVSLQDLGAAGLTSSAAEMASEGRRRASTSTCRRVPLREAGMEPFEIMVSESQERMLCVVEPARVDDVLASARALGGRRDGDRRGHRHRPPARAATATSRGRRAGRGAGRRVPALRPRARPSRRRRSTRRRARTLDADDPREVLLALLGSPNLASRRPVFEQYDCVVAVAHRAPARRRPTPPCSQLARGGGAHRGVDRRQRPPRGLRPLPRARSRRCSSARPTSPASAPSRSG